LRYLFAIFVLLGPLVHAPAPAYAQTPAPPAQQEQPRFNTEVVVTPERGETPRASVPAATVVLDAENIPTLPAAHLSEMIPFMAGFTVARSEFHAGRPVVSSRGFFGGGEAEYLLLLVDGVPVADVESGLIDWSVVPTASIRRVEAFRGPGASLYGDSAVGGVIQVLTDRAATGGQLTTTGGSFSTFTGDGAYGRRQPGVSFNVSGAARTTSGAFDHSGGHQLVGSGGLDGRFHDFSWRWSATGDRRERDDPGALTRDAFEADPDSSDPVYRYDTTDRGSFLTAFTLRHATPSWRPQVRVFASARDEDLIRTILLAPGVPDRRARALSTGALGGSVDGEHAFAAWPVVLRFGFDLSREHLDSTYRNVSATGAIGDVASDVSGRRVRGGAFVSAGWQPAPRVRVSGALRWDGVDDDDFGGLATSSSPAQDAWSPRAGIVVHLNASGTASVFGQVSRAFKVPTLDQLFDARPFPDFMGGTFTISNPNLLAQRANNIEGGVAGGDLVRWSAVAYRMTVDNEIDFDVRTFSYGNIGRSRHVGLELEGEGRWWTRVRPSVSYALSRTVDTETDRQLKNVPRHTLGVAANVDFGWRLSTYARYSHSAGAYLDDESAFPIEGASRLDVRVRRPIGRHLAFLDLYNVTNDRYEEYGFTLTSFTGQVVPYIYPGAGAAIRGGLTLAF
jgi:outer membrane receptor protein involved in Fe transport